MDQINESLSEKYRKKNSISLAPKGPKLYELLSGGTVRRQRIK